MTDNTHTLRQRVRWHSRRGLLELDLFFERFFQTHLNSLSEAELEDLLDILTNDDIALWAMLSGSEPCSVEKWKPLVALLQSSAPPIPAEPC